MTLGALHRRLNSCHPHCSLPRRRNGLPATGCSPPVRAGGRQLVRQGSHPGAGIDDRGLDLVQGAGGGGGLGDGERGGLHGQGARRNLQVGPGVAGRPYGRAAGLAVGGEEARPEVRCEQAGGEPGGGAGQVPGAVARAEVVDVDEEPGAVGGRVADELAQMQIAVAEGAGARGRGGVPGPRGAAGPRRAPAGRPGRAGRRRGRVPWRPYGRCGGPCRRGGRRAPRGRRPVCLPGPTARTGRPGTRAVRWSSFPRVLRSGCAVDGGTSCGQPGLGSYARSDGPGRPRPGKLEGRASPQMPGRRAVRRTPVPTGFTAGGPRPGPLSRARGAAQRPSIPTTDDACVMTASQPPKTTARTIASGSTMATATRGWRVPADCRPPSAAAARRPCARRAVRPGVSTMVPLPS